MRVREPAEMSERQTDVVCSLSRATTLRPSHSSVGGDGLPNILVIVQNSLEGKLSRKTIQAQLARGHRSACNLIPWTMSQQFSDNNLAQLSGARIVRLAVHPAVQGIMELLYWYHNGELMSLSSSVDDDNMCDKGEDDDDVSSETTSESDDSEDEPLASYALLHGGRTGREFARRCGERFSLMDE